MATNTFFWKIRKAFRAVGFGVAPATTTADDSVPLITAGAGAASASDPAGSLRLRTNGVPEYRISSAWQPVAVAGTAFSLGAGLTATTISGTGAATFTSTVTTTDGVTSGTARRVGGVAYRSVAASAAITGTTETDTAFDAKYPIPADTLKAGTVLRVRAQGIYTATTGNETHTLALKIGSTALCSLTLIDPADNDLFYFDAVIQIRTAGAGGTMVACGTALTQAATAVGTAKPWFIGSTAVDTTGAMDLAVFMDRQGTATDSDSARLDIFVVEVIG
jgi:hypothetical protein